LPLLEDWIKFLYLKDNSRISKERIAVFEDDHWLKSKNGNINQKYINFRMNHPNSIAYFSSNNPGFDCLLTLQISEDDGKTFVQKNFLLQAKLRQKTTDPVLMTFHNSMLNLIPKFPIIGLRKTNTSIILYSPTALNQNVIGTQIEDVKLHYKIKDLSRLVAFLQIYKTT